MTYNCGYCAEPLTGAPIKRSDGWFFYCAHCGGELKIMPIFKRVNWKQSPEV